MTPEEVTTAIDRSIADKIKEHFKSNGAIKAEEVTSIINSVLNSYSEYLEPTDRSLYRYLKGDGGVV